ncbi:MAG: flagellar biosynthesis protein FlhA [Gemmatimonadales bacterium]|nr:flagellar biosynthesis protein FlhA [Gemmatimonadota bacterium]MCL4214669.1 flagellar biosynthesis protein FlhA [Gemmatimonadales bacterium]
MSPSTVAARTARNTEVWTALGVLFVLALLIVPLPGILVDLFLAFSLGASIIVLLVALQSTRPLDFSSFPTVLLLLTLFRLAMNVSSTRLILSGGHAGEIIPAFGEFVIGGNYVVGLVLFLILVAINFIVITKGAGRVAEVSARFTLDALPGKQMAIDGELAHGAIDAAEARIRREAVGREADFFGAMDGASRFVKGDAIAALLITAVNIVGGIVIGVMQQGLPLADAAAKFTILTVGEGLVSQIPALIVSTAAGIMVTHASEGVQVGTVLSKQIAGHPRALRLAGGVIAAFGLVPGLPKLPFLGIGLALLFIASAVDTRQAEAKAAAVPAAAPAPAPVSADPLDDLLQIEPIELEVGYLLIPLADQSQGGDLLKRIGLLRQQCAQDPGILVPPVRILDNLGLPGGAYVVKVRGTEKARGDVMPQFLLALDTGRVTSHVEGIDTIDPSFGMRARWVATSRRADALAAGFDVVEPATVIATHLIETVKRSAAELLGRQDVQQMLDALKKTHPAVVEEVVPGKLSLGGVHRVLQRLLRERVPIRDLVTILEALGDAADSTKDPVMLTEHVRRALSDAIVRSHLDDQGVLPAITLGPRLEQQLSALLAPRSGQPAPNLTPETVSQLIRELEHVASARAIDGRLPPLVVPSALRLGVRNVLEPVLPYQPVLSLAELPANVQLSAIATWEVQRVAA